MQMLLTQCAPHFLIDMCLVTDLFLSVISILLMFHIRFTFNYLSSYDDHSGTNVSILQSAIDAFHCVEKCAKHLSNLRK